ncbi:MAG TPA: CHASE domain-containing protein [Ignavibacteriales bacterium]|nr:CHASE domain-containing protein [Ignavibacteriales bacterium]
MIVNKTVYKYSNATAIAALIFFLGLTFWLWMVSRRDTEQNAKERFDFRVLEIRQAINQRMQEYEKVLLGGAGLFDVAKPVTRRMWHDYVERLRITETSPGIQGVGFAILLRPQEVKANVEKVRREGFPSYHIWPEGKRDFYTSIIYLEPFSGINLRAFGYDMYSEPVRRKAMAQAMDSGMTSLTGKVILVQEGTTAIQAGFLMYVPVYERDMVLSTVEERRKAIIGFVYSPFRTKDLINGIFGRGLSDIRLRIYDGELPNKKDIMYDSGIKGDPKDSLRTPLLSRSEQIDINDHTWTLQFSTLPLFEKTVDNQKSPIILFSGIIISLLFAAVVKSLSSTRARALALALEITKRKDAEDALKEEISRAQMLIRVSNIFAELSLNYRAVLDRAAQVTSELIGDAAVVRLLSDDRKLLEPAAFYHPEGSAGVLIQEVLFSGPQEAQMGISGRVVSTSESLMIPEVKLSEIESSLRPECIKYFEKYGFHGILIAPLKVGRQMIGTLGVLRTKPGKSYTAKDKSFLEELANRIAIAIVNSRLHQEKVHEIEERSLAEEKLKKTLDDLARSNRELENFAYVASHDLQEPLRMISSYTQLLSKRYKGQLDAKADQFIEFTVDGAKRMQQLIHDLLEYSRVATRGKEFVPVDTNEIIKTVLNNLQISIKKNNAVITYDNLPRVTGDDIQLMQLFQNLLSNSLKFKSNKTPEINIHAEDKGSEWLFSVSDNGIGLDPQFKERIFIIFQRLHEREEYPGTGIGLAVCKKIVERHGGRIWVESEPGEGSTFFFTIPKRNL